MRISQPHAEERLNVQVVAQRLNCFDDPHSAGDQDRDAVGQAIYIGQDM
jgi:hypothetical protein